MHEYQTIIDGHIFLLNQRGYNERDLKNKRKPGYLIGRLEAAFEKAITASYTCKQLQHFFLETMGAFGNGSDKMDFKFHYQYNPANQHLHLQSLVARLGVVQKIYFLAKSNYLPESSKIYQALVKENQSRLEKEKLRVNNTNKKNQL